MNMKYAMTGAVAGFAITLLLATFGSVAISEALFFAPLVAIVGAFAFHDGITNFGKGKK